MLNKIVYFEENDKTKVGKLIEINDDHYLIQNLNDPTLFYRISVKTKLNAINQKY